MRSDMAVKVSAGWRRAFAIASFAAVAACNVLDGLDRNFQEEPCFHATCPDASLDAPDQDVSVETGPSRDAVAEADTSLDAVSDADLTVTITAAQGVRASVTVTGPGGFSSTITQSTSWPNLAAGDYVVSAAKARRPLPIVDEIYTPSPASQTIHVAGAGATMVATVNYTLRPGSGFVWLGSFGTDRVVGYKGPELTPSPAPTPATLILPAHSGPEGTAIDAAGNLWVANLNSATVSMFAAADLGSTSTASPRVSFKTQGRSLRPTDMAFDGSGNLWVASSDGYVWRYDASSLNSNSAMPATTLSIAGAFSVAFDSSGSLWVSAFVAGSSPQSGTTIRIDQPASIQGMVSSVHPSVSLPKLGEVAFDASGNLWMVGPSCASTIYKYTASSLTQSAPAPAVTITGLSCADSLAFDNEGTLWVTDSPLVDGGIAIQLLAFRNPSALSSTNTPSPDLTIPIQAAAIDIPRLTFDAPPTNLPLAQ
jgi:sugar lactone lactonase YvrE